MRRRFQWAGGLPQVQPLASQDLDHGADLLHVNRGWLWVAGWVGFAGPSQL